MRWWRDKMDTVFTDLIFPFVYLDSSYLYRANSSVAQKLTRTTLAKNPRRFCMLLEEVVDAAKADYRYYDGVISLQRKKIISTLVTYEATNPALTACSKEIIQLFGRISVDDFIASSRQLEFADDVVLWGETVKTNTYYAAATAIADSTCIVADANFFSLTVGWDLANYIKSDCVFILLSSNKPERFLGENYIDCKLSPKEFIQLLCSRY